MVDYRYRPPSPCSRLNFAITDAFPQRLDAPPKTAPGCSNGSAPGRPLSVSGLRRHLTNAGIHTRAAHNSALIELATDLPAPVVAETLGVHIETAVRWSKYARRDWTDYLAVRADVLRPSTGAGEESTGTPDEDTRPTGHGAVRSARLVGMFN
jgi:hypothetical protein